MQKAPFAGAEIARSFSRWTKDELCASALSSSSLFFPGRERKRKNGRARAAIIIFGGAEPSWVELSRVERSYHSHICKPTGRTVWKLQARDALSLVLSVGHGPRGDGKITGTKLVWPPSRGTLSRDPGIGTGARAREGPWCEMHAACVRIHYC